MSASPHMRLCGARLKNCSPGLVNQQSRCRSSVHTISQLCIEHYTGKSGALWQNRHHSVTDFTLASGRARRTICVVVECRESLRPHINAGNFWFKQYSRYLYLSLLWHYAKYFAWLEFIISARSVLSRGGRLQWKDWQCYLIQMIM